MTERPIRPRKRPKRYSARRKSVCSTRREAISRQGLRRRGRLGAIARAGRPRARRSCTITFSSTRRGFYRRRLTLAVEAVSVEGWGHLSSACPARHCAFGPQGEARSTSRARRRVPSSAPSLLLVARRRCLAIWRHDAQRAARSHPRSSWAHEQAGRIFEECVALSSMISPPRAIVPSDVDASRTSSLRVARRCARSPVTRRGVLLGYLARIDVKSPPFRRRRRRVGCGYVMR